MNQDNITSIIKQGEGINVEFKKCTDSLSENVFETVCSFLNRFGGELLLGVSDDGKIPGVNNPFPAKFVIEKDRVFAENSNKPHGHGLINPENFSPFPKNPVIARIFKEIGRADELGSGVRKLFKYCKIYSGQSPQLIEEDIFKTIIPLTKTEQATEQATEQVTEQVKRLLRVCGGKALPSREIMNKLNLSHRPTFLYKYLQPALENSLIKMTVPDKPKSSKQKYIITKKGESIVDKSHK